MGDPFDDFDLWDSQQSASLSECPICCCCEEPIQTEQAIYYADQWFCEDCEDEARDIAWEDTREDYLTSTTD